MKKITAKVNTDKRLYFELDHNGMVHVWDKNYRYGAWKVERFNDGKFSRDWVREFAGLSNLTIGFLQ